MFSIERNGSDWVVAQDGATMSVHPSREEAERSLEWLFKKHNAEAGSRRVMMREQPRFDSVASSR